MRLSFFDVLRVGSAGLRTRPLRVFLSALGIAIGIAAMVSVVGVLDPVPLAPELDTAALIGWPVATGVLDFDGYPTTIYSRARDDAVLAVQDVLAATANPSALNEVQVSRPSDALEGPALYGRALPW